MVVAAATVVGSGVATVKRAAVVAAGLASAAGAGAAEKAVMAQQGHWWRREQLPGPETERTCSGVRDSSCALRARAVVKAAQRHPSRTTSGAAELTGDRRDFGGTGPTKRRAEHRGRLRRGTIGQHVILSGNSGYGSPCTMEFPRKAGVVPTESVAGCAWGRRGSRVCGEVLADGCYLDP